VSGERLRYAAICLFAAAAVLVGVGRDSGQSWLVAAAFLLFTAGAFAFLRWRTRMRGNVFDRQDKTSDEDPKP
jgi:hypothetical protein